MISRVDRQFELPWRKWKVTWRMPGGELMGTSTFTEGSTSTSVHLSGTHCDSEPLWHPPCTLVAPLKHRRRPCLAPSVNPPWTLRNQSPVAPFMNLICTLLEGAAQRLGTFRAPWMGSKDEVEFRNLPWTFVAPPAGVPLRFTDGYRLGLTVRTVWDSVARWNP